MNQLLEEYKYNIIAAETKQYKVLSRDRWAFVFLLMAREVKRLQSLIDAQGQDFGMVEFKQELPTQGSWTQQWPGYGPDAISEVTK